MTHDKLSSKWMQIHRKAWKKVESEDETKLDWTHAYDFNYYFFNFQNPSINSRWTFMQKIKKGNI